MNHTPKDLEARDRAKLIRFMAKVEKTESCWLWRAEISTAGYGRFWSDNRKHNAHRWLYTTLYGDVPKNLDCCHVCDIRECVNPEHIFIGTRSENMKDAYFKGRGTLPKRSGADLYNSSLSREDIERLIIDPELVSKTEVVRVLGSSAAVIQQIRRGESYKKEVAAARLKLKGPK